MFKKIGDSFWDTSCKGSSCGPWISNGAILSQNWGSVGSISLNVATGDIVLNTSLNIMNVTPGITINKISSSITPVAQPIPVPKPLPPVPPTPPTPPTPPAVVIAPPTTPQEATPLEIYSSRFTPSYIGTCPIEGLDIFLPLFLIAGDGDLVAALPGNGNTWSSLGNVHSVQVRSAENSLGSYVCSAAEITEWAFRDEVNGNRFTNVNGTSTGFSYGTTMYDLPHFQGAWIAFKNGVPIGYLGALNSSLDVPIANLDPATYCIYMGSYAGDPFWPSQEAYVQYLRNVVPNSALEHPILDEATYVVESLDFRTQYAIPPVTTSSHVSTGALVNRTYVDFVGNEVINTSSVFSGNLSGRTELNITNTPLITMAQIQSRISASPSTRGFIAFANGTPSGALTLINARYYAANALLDYRDYWAPNMKWESQKSTEVIYYVEEGEIFGQLLTLTGGAQTTQIASYTHYNSTNVVIGSGSITGALRDATIATTPLDVGMLGYTPPSLPVSPTPLDLLNFVQYGIGGDIPASCFTIQITQTPTTTQPYISSKLPIGLVATYQGTPDPADLLYGDLRLWNFSNNQFSVAI